MHKLLSIDPEVLNKIRDLPKKDRTECLLAMSELYEGFGKPHIDSGLGIRKLGGSLFECRANRSLRFLFQNRVADLYVFFSGSHDDIKALLRSKKL